MRRLYWLVIPGAGRLKSITLTSSSIWGPLTGACSPCATTRWWWVVHLALVFLQWRARAGPPGRPCSIPALIRQQRADHARQVLLAACQQVLQTGSLQSVLERFIAA